MNAPTSNLIHNDHGGITYASPQRIGNDNRHAMLSEVRMVIDGLNELCAEVRRSWPERYPIPPELDALLTFQDYALQRVRSGALATFAKACAE